jgi:Ala-tRNA(Pro) deacylase
MRRVRGDPKTGSRKPMAAREDDLYALFEQRGIGWTRHVHAPVFTVDEAQALRGDLPGAHSKNLFLKGKAGDLWLAVCREDRRIRIRDFERAVGAKKLSFGSADLLRARLGVEPGSVTPFALINDVERLVKVALDAQMMAADLLNFHPLRNDATVAVTSAGLLSFLEATGHAPLEVDFDALEALAPE